jgi:hypothetical protein
VKNHILDRMRDAAYAVWLYLVRVSVLDMLSDMVLYCLTDQVRSYLLSLIVLRPILSWPGSLTIRISMLSLRVSSVTVWITVMALVSWF